MSRTRPLLPVLLLATLAPTGAPAAAQASRRVDPRPDDPPTILAAVGDFFVECVRTLRTFRGSAAGDQFGWVSTPIPDVTGDGVTDLAIGAPFTSATASGAGRVFLRDGATGQRLLRVDGGAAGENLGYSIRDAGDVDGDGTCDLIAGGRGSATTAGLARVWSGATRAEILVVSAGVVGDSFGWSVTGLGDVDGDGLGDVAAGATTDDTAAQDAGRVYVLSGADGSVLWTIEGKGAGHNFGSGLGRLSDVTHDGVDELIVGAMNDGVGARGKAYVYDVAQKTELYAMTADPSGVVFGQYFVADCGDVDADGVHDVYVGDFGDANGRGKAYVFDGETGARLRVYAGGAGDGFGIGRGAGDVNGDGHADLILCGWRDSEGAFAAGKCSIISGADSAILQTYTSTTMMENFGFDAHGMGDLDGDGQLDFVSTAANAENGRGKVYVLAGGSQCEVFGAGLAGTGGIVPRIAFTGCPELGESVSLDVSDVRGNAPGLLVLGTTLQATPIFGGILYTDPLYRMGHVAAGAIGVAGDGVASLPLTVPLDPAFAGIDFRAQALYLDPDAAQGVSFTNAVRFSTFAGL